MGKEIGNYVSYKQLFLDYMNAEGIRYTDEGENRVRVSYSGDNLKSIPVYVFFDKDGDPIVRFVCWDVANFKNKDERGIKACNELNAKWRWVKFYVDKDSDIIVECDAYVDAETCGETCMRLVRRMVNITDEAYPDIAKALWS